MINNLTPQSAQAVDPSQIIAESSPSRGVDFILRRIGPTTLVSIHPDNGMVAGRWLDKQTLAAAADWAERKNTAGSNIYYTVNLPRIGMAKKPRKDDIEAIRGVYADVDAKDGRTMEQAFAAIQPLPAPSLLIMSGGGFQSIWLFDRPEAVTPDAVACAEAMGARIAEVTGGDPVKNIDRILRVPDTVNWPDARKRAAGRQPSLATVLIGADDTVRCYPAAALNSALGSLEITTVVNSAEVIAFPGTPPTLAGRASSLNAAARAGLEPDWFDAQPSAKKNHFLRAIAGHLKALADAERPEWLKYLFAFADAEHRGAHEAREIALVWCKTSSRFKSEGDFNRDF